VGIQIDNNYNIVDFGIQQNFIDQGAMSVKKKGFEGLHIVEEN